MLLKPHIQHKRTQLSIPGVWERWRQSRMIGLWRKDGPSRASAYNLSQSHNDSELSSFPQLFKIFTPPTLPLNRKYKYMLQCNRFEWIMLWPQSLSSNLQNIKIHQQLPLSRRKDYEATWIESTPKLLHLKLTFDSDNSLSKLFLQSTLLLFIEWITSLLFFLAVNQMKFVRHLINGNKQGGDRA